MKGQTISILIFSACMLFIFSSVASSYAQTDDERNFLLLYFKPEELVVESPTRSPKPVSQVAENVTVITANDIKRMNAHTVADVLNTITGVQVLISGGPGSVSQASIEGSESRHVAVFMDGIPLNNLSDNVTDLGSLPVQNIEKIEIIKGPASSAWGSALGGVINIITKSGSKEGQTSMVSASYGEKNTGDFRAEASGRQERLGYYFTAGRLQTDGFRPHNDFWGNNAYAKLAYDITENTSALFTVGYDRLSRGVVEFPTQDRFINNTLETSTSTFAINSLLNKETTFNLSFWHLHQINNFYNYQLSSGIELSNTRYDDNGYGSSAKLTWKHQQHNVVMGADYDSKTERSDAITGGEHRLGKWAFYTNDTISFARLSVTPGIRYDKTDTNGDFASPSLGMTYKVADTTLLRAFAARGFNIPPFSFTYGNSNIFFVPNPGLKMEKVWSYELGAETAALKYLWVKLSAFRHDIGDAIQTKALTGSTFTYVNGEKQRRQGIEIEMKSVPVYHTSLSAGAAYMNTKDLDTGQTIPGVPQRTYDLGLQYDDEKSFKALLKGHYIYWNSDPSFQGKYDSFIFDLHAIKNLYSRDEHALEAFMDIHNIFNSSQYPTAFYKNPERWFEAGIRYMF